MSESGSPSIPSSGIPSFGPSVGIVVSRPENVVFHWVQTHELESLMKIEKPFSLAIASAATGCALGLIPTLQASYVALKELPKMTSYDVYWDMGYVGLFALSVGIAIVTWINAYSGKTEAEALLETIKKRPMLNIGS